MQFRDANPAKLDELHTDLEDVVSQADRSGPCKVRLETSTRSIPAVMDRSIQQAFEAAATEYCSGKHTLMPSGAGPDAQIVARHLPSDMLFVPSIGGVSHYWTKSTSDEDVVMGARVFASATGRLLTAAS